MTRGKVGDNRVFFSLLHHRIFSEYAAGETTKGLSFIAPKLHVDR
jgi:hypothetical protein